MWYNVWDAYPATLFGKERYTISRMIPPARLLLDWYDVHKRTLPWRDTNDPYAVWISEIMLQQTRVETVLAYFPRFMALFPTVRALAEAPEQTLLKAWEGLGYYSRARNLQKAAKQVMDAFGGRLPRTAEELRALPGIGPYTAGAIASIAFGEKAPAIDGNVMRVVSRLTGIREDISIPGIARHLAQEAAALVPEDRPGDFNQAMMDLGATVCLPGTPACDQCPLSGCCDAYAAGDAELLPIKMKARAPRQIAMGVGLVTSGGRILVAQRQEKLLGGLFVFVLNEKDDTPAAMGKKLKALGLSARFQGDIATANHVFTHQVWNMRLMHFTAPEAKQLPGYQWASPAALDTLPFPTAMKAAKREAGRLLEGKEGGKGTF